MRSLIILFCALLIQSCTWIGVKGNGNVVDIQRDVLDFSEISVNGAFDVFIRQGNTNEVILRIDDNLDEFITVEVEGDRLKIQPKRPIRKASSKEIYITLENLTELDMNGAISLSSKRIISFKNIHIECNGASEISMNLRGENLVYEGNGSSSAQLNGDVERAKLEINGSGKIDAPGFEINRAQLDINGSGDATLYVNESLDVSINGSGEVYYYGEPALTQSVNGSGNIQKKSKNESENI